ncbi:MAG: hypothetical protein COT74_00275 [Bdellovibrionales bacterium CG10_big_fil_rev_8_21_14_0_10_45_34]|nr:MAG: hypothetical protein COT74_00275 [Bdellovibrionales bacterium CG10_big_fil_rev_8_21_14_0_10_45_34]
MDSIVFRVFPILFRLIGILVITGVFVSVLTDIQQKAFSSKRTGLIRMLSVNQQLVGKTK